MSKMTRGFWGVTLSISAITLLSNVIVHYIYPFFICVYCLYSLWVVSETKSISQGFGQVVLSSVVTLLIVIPIDSAVLAFQPSMSASSWDVVIVFFLYFIAQLILTACASWLLSAPFAFFIRWSKLRKERLQTQENE